ncbi:oxidoreductase [Alicyclobacillus sp. SO9]|uniref:oxidoreductase n=1 Tax=Alicyclobacillus sp. SO9 TaxID=2665646 RepID=UPI0018E74729|nr:oxidoreductase [Alicyclobacillus sp. SO9]QQE79897.1 SDR family oxidoreductase [Alicyclobacillus sp. SO9]
MEKWDVSNMPQMSGKVVVVTGANSGIGFESAKALAGNGATVVLAVRNLKKGMEAADKIQQMHQTARVKALTLDLADLASIRAFPEQLNQAGFVKLDVLVNNAGVMAPPLKKTTDGFELQFGTNHLGHFVLTHQLLPFLKQEGGRVVSVSSMAHVQGQIDFENLDAAKGYSRWRFYGQSKLANLLFAYELQRRLTAAGWPVISVACHPGFAATNLTAAGVGMNMGVFGRGLAAFANLFAQSAYMGALPTVYAAVNENLRGGEYIGPVGKSGMKGYPGIVKSNDRSYDTELAQKLWRVSEDLTGVHYSFE